MVQRENNRLTSNQSPQGQRSTPAGKGPRSGGAGSEPTRNFSLLQPGSGSFGVFQAISGSIRTFFIPNYVLRFLLCEISLFTILTSLPSLSGFVRVGTPWSGFWAKKIKSLRATSILTLHHGQARIWPASGGGEPRQAL
jgi:hypothetical protein